MLASYLRGFVVAVPEELFTILQEMQKSLVLLQSREQQREVVFENSHKVFDEMQIPLQTPALLFILILRVAMRNPILSDIGTAVLSSERWLRLYDKMAQDLDEHGATLLRGGKTSQSDIFDLKDSIVTPGLKAADSVLATVLYLRTEFSEPLSEAVRDIFLPYFIGAQDEHPNAADRHQGTKVVNYDQQVRWRCIA